MCTHPEKIAYHNLKDAITGALRVLAKYGIPQRPYMCECGQYHLTTQDMHGGRPLTAERVHYLAAAHLDTMRGVARPTTHRERTQ